jgi:hypothetical protein
VDAEFLVVGQAHRGAGGAPGRDLGVFQAEDGGHARIVVRAFGAQALGDVGRERHVHARHRIRVVVVVDHGRVFVRARHFVDAEALLAVVAADAESRCAPCPARSRRRTAP